VAITALKSDHSTYTVDGTISNHSAGRAMDIGAVDGEICRGWPPERLVQSGDESGGGADEGREESPGIRADALHEVLTAPDDEARCFEPCASSGPTGPAVQLREENPHADAGERRRRLVADVRLEALERPGRRRA
jgi:hypothetical protein